MSISSATWSISLDLSAIEKVYEKEWRGQPPYHPRLMVKLLVYGYCLGLRSSRKIAQRLVEDVPLRVLAADNQPDFRTISDFRRIHLEALEQLFQQVLRLALEAGALRLGRVALDGTKMKANASKHKAMSWGRMKQAEKQIREEVKQMLAEAAEADAAEDARYGPEKTGQELPEELQRRQTRLEKIRQAQKALQQRARDKAATQRPTAGENPQSEAARQGTVQLQRSGVAHHERRRRVLAGLQRAGSGGGGLSVDRGADGDAGGER